MASTIGPAVLTKALMVSNTADNPVTFERDSLGIQVSSLKYAVWTRVAKVFWSLGARDSLVIIGHRPGEVISTSEH